MTEGAERRKERRVEWSVAACFLGAAAGAVGFTFFWWWDGNLQVEGAFGGAGLLLLAVGLVRWSHHLMPEGPFVEEYPELRSPASEEAEMLAALDRGAIGRRRLLIGSLGVAGLSVTVGAVSTIRFIGPAPASLAHTAWRGGRLAVDSEGRPVHADDLAVGGILTLYPQGFVESPNADAILIRVPAGLNRPLPGRESWAPGGLLCYSKVCSHAGCPVNLYNHQTYELECPCHQSTFDVLEGAKPVFGPAGGPLAQLPLAIGSDGLIRSTGDFSGPVGPVYWHRSVRS